MTLMMRQNSTETQTHLLRQLFRLRSRLLQCARPQQKRFPSSEPYNPRAELSLFRFPSVDLLRPAKDNGPSVDIREMEFNKRRLTETLRTFGVEISKIEATIGPTVTLYEIIPAEGVRTRSIRSLGDDLQLQLAAEGVRIIAPIPAKGTIGIEVPNKDPQVVSMRSVLDSEVYRNSKMELPMALGKTISNDIFMADLAKMPHLLVAGATGMGKSVGLNAIITSLLYKKHPSELKFVLIDPKRVELSLYRELERHYLASLPGEDAIITDMSKVVTVLNSLYRNGQPPLAARTGRSTKHQGIQRQIHCPQAQSGETPFPPLHCADHRRVRRPDHPSGQRN